MSTNCTHGPHAKEHAMLLAIFMRAERLATFVNEEIAEIKADVLALAEALKKKNTDAEAAQSALDDLKATVKSLLADATPAPAADMPADAPAA